MQDTSFPIPPLTLSGNFCKLIRHLGDFDWQGIEIEPYKADSETWKGMSRRELIGKRGESPLFHLRYFEISAGGYSTPEKHQHEHVVIVVRGRGEARLADKVHEVGFGDVVYVSPGTPHQFSNRADAAEPLGFFCIVNAERDRPQTVDGSDACFVCA